MRHQTIRLACALIAAGCGLFPPVLAADLPSPAPSPPSSSATLGPDTLPGQVIGVVGSGDQLSLQLKAGDGARLLRLGDVYGEGWVLTGLTSSIATLGKDGQVRQVGLNPQGALAQADNAPATRVLIDGTPPEILAILAMSDEEVLAQATPTERSIYSRAGTTYVGLSGNDGVRYQLDMIRRRLLMPKVAAFYGQAGRTDLINPMLATYLGQDYIDLDMKVRTAGYQNQSAAVAQATAKGITSLVMPAGISTDQFFAEAGVSSDGFVRHQLEGGVTDWVLRPQPAPPVPLDQPQPRPTLIQPLPGEVYIQSITVGAPGSPPVVVRAVAQ